MSALRPCPYCQRIDWSNAPALRDTLAWIDQQRGQAVTSRDVADRFRVPINNASNRMDALARLGAIEQVGTENVRGGGTRRLWRITEDGELEVRLARWTERRAGASRAESRGSRERAGD